MLSVSFISEITFIFNSPGMMTHAGYQTLPFLWRAVLPVYGLPLLGYNEVVAANNRTSILALHDRFDHTIPEEGGKGYGWFYESEDNVLGAWAALHACDTKPTDVTTPFDGGSRNLACREWLGCTTFGAEHRVMECLYNGGHGTWPEQGEALTAWFFNQSSYEV
jgi:poly(3-hydroxybutyrate) depolymerase